jgi:hypothetical protein
MGIVYSCTITDIDEKVHKSGKIISFVYIECLCCPGWVINTGKDTIKAQTLPNEEILWEIVEKEGYPVNIEFDYENFEGICSDRYKKVTYLKILDK